MLLKALIRRFLHDSNAEIALIVTAAALILYASLTVVRSTTQSKPLHPALASLSKVIIPTCSIWPQFYLDLTRTADDNHYCSSRICIPLTVLLRDIKQGRIELRDPTNLYLLMQGRLTVDGWRFNLTLSLKERVKSLSRYLIDDLKISMNNVCHPITVSNNTLTH